MTKVEAICKVLEENGGTATLTEIYQKIGKYYPSIDKSQEWQAGVRGVLYREIRQKKLFKKIGLSIYALEDYKIEKKPVANPVKMHSYIEGICVELGNFKKYGTYTADCSVIYRDNITLGNLVTLRELPQFSYSEITHVVKNIDVIWFNSKGLLFPQKVFEIVDSPNTMTNAFNRCLQLQNFRTEFYIVAPEIHRKKFTQLISYEIYNSNRFDFRFINYDSIIELYERTALTNKLEDQVFGHS